MSQNITTTCKDIANDHIFGSSFHYRIPLFQRDYKWEKSNIDDLWNDMMEEGNLFIGSILLEKTEDFSQSLTREVIDGQQRIISFTIMAAALRDYITDNIINKLSEEDNSTYATLFHAKELRHKTIRIFLQNGLGENIDKVDLPEYNNIEKNKFKLMFRKQNNLNKNNAFYEGILQTYFDSEERRKFFNKLQTDNISQKNASNRYKNLMSYIYEHCDAKIESKKLEKAQEIFKEMTDVTVVAIEILEPGRAIDIFQTINDRGMNLELAELIKSLIFNRLDSDKDSDLDDIDSKWNEIYTRVNDCNWKMDDFVRYWFLSCKDFSTKNEIYKRLEKDIKSSEDANELLDRLDECSKIISLISFDPIERFEGLRDKANDSLPKTKKKKRSNTNRLLQNIDPIIESLRACGILGNKQYLVLVIAIFNKVFTNIDFFNRAFGKGENRRQPFELISKLFKHFEIFSFNFIALGDKKAVKVETIFSDLALKFNKIIDNNDAHEDKLDKLEKFIDNTIYGQRDDSGTIEGWIDDDGIKHGSLYCTDFIPKDEESFRNKFFDEIRYGITKKEKDIVRYVLAKINEVCTRKMQNIPSTKKRLDSGGWLDVFYNFQSQEKLLDKNKKLHPTGNLTIEHIFPQHFTEPPKDKNGNPEKAKGTESINYYKNNIGNLSIMDNEENRDLSNILPTSPEKLNAYKESDLHINKEVCKRLENIQKNGKDFNIEEITNRANSLIDYAVEVWFRSTYKNTETDQPVE
tara:strand:+ start:84 stop:2327 length:2244 start_codon:yes stop_codon:yes gene_type:complete